MTSKGLGKLFEADYPIVPNNGRTEFPIVSSSSSMLEEPVYVSEEPKQYNANPSEDICFWLPQKIPY